uniref:Aminotransferase-like plant mobile domain-containing protein n=1 Tax=Cajanus cajan TaxID=3821 RepID=A0A151RLZ1_CAJCA|nr:hypothetical protein KK1_034965 [Cajanus cajan]
MLLSAIFFWNRETRAIEFSCGFVCPTLLDIAAIMGLKPLGDRYLPNTLEEEIPMTETSIVWDKKKYSAFVSAHHGEEGTPVTDSEHIAFLLYWLSACVFCTPSLQVPKYYYTLAQALHLKKKICLSKLLLASFYNCLDEASKSLFRETGPRNLTGPLWLLQLWLNAIFEKKLKLLPLQASIRYSLEGARLTALTPKKKSVDGFACYVQAILEFEEFSNDLAPFIRADLVGLSWLIGNNQVGQISQEMVKIWMGFLSWDLIFTGMKQRDVRVYPYQPQIFARQFGLCQIRPTPLFPKDRIDSDVCVEDVDYDGFLKFILTPSTQLNLTPCSFLPAFLVSNYYLRWWCSYYTDKMFSFEDFSRKLTNSPFSLQGPKISGIYDNRNIISQFKLYYRVCYRPENMFRTIFDATLSLTRMVQWNIRRNKVIDPQGQTTFAMFCPKDIPPLPNALFGLAKRLDYPPWVKTLDPSYEDNKNIPVKDRVTSTRCSVYDFPRDKQ